VLLGVVAQFDFLRRSIYLDSRKTAKAIAPRIPSATDFGSSPLCRRIGTRTSAIRKAVSIPYQVIAIHRVMPLPHRKCAAKLSASAREQNFQTDHYLTMPYFPPTVIAIENRAAGSAMNRQPSVLSNDRRIDLRCELVNSAVVIGPAMYGRTVKIARASATIPL